jgi:hypothetical protein
MSGLTPNAATSGGATSSASISDLAQQHGVSRESLVEFVQAKVQQARQESGQPPLDQATLEEMIGHTLDQGGQTASDADGSAGAETSPAGGYTSNAQPAVGETHTAGRISILA